MNGLSLPSGVVLDRPLDSILAFCREEYAYYDDIASTDPDTVQPLDVLATVSVNSFINAAPQVRRVHRCLQEACDPVLRRIPEQSDLADQSGPGLIRELVAPALGCPGVLIAVATKVLHRKRRRLVPMLDAVLLRHYLAPTQPRLVAASIEKGPRTLEAFEEAVRKFREDLFSAAGMLEDIRNALMAEGFDLSRVRILEVATWMSKEERGYYR